VVVVVVGAGRERRKREYKRDLPMVIVHKTLNRNLLMAITQQITNSNVNAYLSMSFLSTEHPKNTNTHHHLHHNH